MGGSSGGGSSAPSSTTTVNKSEPWEGQKPVLTDVYNRAQTAYEAVPKAAYGGQYIASPVQLQRDAQTEQLKLARSLQGSGDSTLAMANDMLSGRMLDPATNPNLQATIDASLRPLYQNFNSQVVPGINSAAIQSGAYGGARQGLALGEATQALQTSAAETSAKIAYENYVRERQNQMQAPQMISAGVQLNAQPAAIMENVGNTQQVWGQDLLDEQYQQYIAGQQAPWIGLPEYAGIVQNGSFGGSSSGTATMSGSARNRTAGAMSGAVGGGLMGGLGAYSMLGNPVMWSNPWTAAAIGGGAILGGLMGGL